MPIIKKMEAIKMKKIIFMSIITIISIGSIIYFGVSYTASIPAVSVIRLTADDVENTITASGNIECPKSECVSINNNMLITDVLVHSGDEIRKGTALCKGIVIPDNFLQNSDVISTFTNNISDLSELYDTSILSEQAAVTVYSDKSGNIATVSMEKDTYMSDGDTLVTLSNQQYNTVVLNIPETQICDVEVGQSVIVSITAVPNKTFTGTVTNIADDAKQTVTARGKETTVEVTVTLNEECNVKNGFSTRCSIITSIEQDTIIIPYECLDSDQNGDFIFLLSEKGTAQKKYIQIKEEYSTGVSFENADIHDGDIIIKDGVGLSDNDKVYIKGEFS